MKPKGLGRRRGWRRMNGSDMDPLPQMCAWVRLYFTGYLDRWQECMHLILDTFFLLCCSNVNGQSLCM